MSLYFELQFQEKTENDALTLSKDRGQFAANTAMSIIQIALLKEVIENGPEHNRYYTFSLVIIATSLVLQVNIIS